MNGIVFQLRKAARVVRKLLFLEQLRVLPRLLGLRPGVGFWFAHENVKLDGAWAAPGTLQSRCPALGVTLMI
jgi:hypothetical protein